jgi:hypothetical protein
MPYDFNGTGLLKGKIREILPYREIFLSSDSSKGLPTLFSEKCFLAAENGLIKSHFTGAS